MNLPFDFNRPPPRVQTLSEAQALIDVLWETLRRLHQRIEHLEERQGLSSRNSSKPPSSDSDEQKARRRSAEPGEKARRRGAQVGHGGVKRALVELERVDEIHRCEPSKECACGGAVELSAEPFERHQVFDLPVIEIEIHEYQRYAGRCQRCGRRHEGQLPTGVPQGQFGAGIVSLIGLLSGHYHLSVRQIQQLLGDVFGLAISLGTISQIQGQLSEALAPITEQAHAAVQQAAVVNVDETSHYQGTLKHWLWVGVSSTLSVFRIDRHRSRQAAETLLGRDFAGVVGSDRYSAYRWVDVERRQLCWAHLLREFQRMAERSGQAGEIGEELLSYGNGLFELWHRYQDGQLSPELFEQFLELLRTLVHLALERGSRCAEVSTRATCNDLLELEAALWTFVTTPGVEPTNNAAERALRGYVIWRKLSFATQSSRGSRFIERILTVVASCRQQGREVLAFLRQAIEAFWFGQPPPSLLPLPDS